MNALYVGPFAFPDGGAEARRVAGIAQSLLLAKHEITIGCGAVCDPRGMLQKSSLSVRQLNERPREGSRNITKLWRALTAGGETATWVENMAPAPDVVLLYGARLGYLVRLVPWSQAKRIPLIVDVVEWYDPRHVLGGPLGPFHLSSEFSMRYFHVKAKNLIVISRYLENYYIQRGCRVIRIPPTLDVQGIADRSHFARSEGPLRLAYTGVPGKKDLLNNVVEALVRVDPHGQKVQLVIAGPKPLDILRLPSLSQRNYRVLPGCVKALGPLSHEEALNVVRHADFSVLLRPPLRYAQAGFPTKVPESLAVGTPVICNLTSDLGDYIKHGLEGLICSDHSVGSFMSALNKAMLLSAEELEGMRAAARKRAEESFDYRNYAGCLNDFIQQAISGCG